jgi:hypothetical protein
MVALSGAFDKLLLLWLLRHGVRVRVWGGCRGNHTGADGVDHGAAEEVSPGYIGA